MNSTEKGHSLNLRELERARPTESLSDGSGESSIRPLRSQHVPQNFLDRVSPVYPAMQQLGEAVDALPTETQEEEQQQ